VIAPDCPPSPGLQYWQCAHRRHLEKTLEETGPKKLSPRIHGTVARNIGVSIVSGAYPPGHAFLGEIEQAEQLGISRSAYREAVRILVAKGLLDSRPKAGTHVNPRNLWNLLDPDVLAWMFEGEPSDAFIRDLFELRGVIEPAAVALAARRREQSHLDAMRVALDEMRRFGLATAEGQAADQRFHRAILKATGNETVLALASSVGSAVSLTTRYKQRNRELPRDPIPDHERVYEAIRRADAGAARNAMNDLLELALQDMGIDGIGSPSRRRRIAREAG
jgi:DNA-binding FadR family transcriptional regulator